MSRQLSSRSVGSRVVGNYVLGKNLGEGTFGKVKLGTHTLSGEHVAIKILDKDKILTAADVERVTRQIHILKIVRHPQIVQLYEIIETSKQLFLVMEYVSQGQLFDYIVKRKKLKEPQACEFFRQIIAGVQYMHSIGIAHRDLKPQNLLVDFNRRLKLVDFGLSNTYKSKQLLKTACGSPCYAAPEMIAGKRYIGLNADIWSCGIILFALICGYLPFEDPNTSLLYKKILSGQFIIPKWVSQDARDLLIGILNVNPEQRFTIKDIKNHPWYIQLGEEHPTFKNGIIIGQNSVPIDQNILHSLQNYQIDTNQAKRHIFNNRHNHISTLYYLMLKKSLKQGINSQYDICSPTFDKKLLQKGQILIQIGKSAEKQERDSENLRNSTAFGSRSTSRKYNRFSQKNNYLNNHQNTIELKLDLNNLPTVQNTLNRKLELYKNKYHTISIDKKPQGNSNMRATLYDVGDIGFNPYGKRPPTTYRPEIETKKLLNKSVDVQGKRYKQRYQNNVEDKDKQIMSKTFMGSIPKGYIPRWNDESERLRGILNTTISVHNKKRAHKLKAYL